MLSQLQKHFQQVSNKLLSPPVKKQAASVVGSKPIINKSSSAGPVYVKNRPIVPPPPSSASKTLNNTSNKETDEERDERLRALVKDDETASSKASPSSSSNTTIPSAASEKQRLEDIKIKRTKSKAARIRSIQHAMSKERTVREAQEPFDFWTNVKQFNWKALIVFMICWTILGYYVVPTIKGWKGFKPPTEQEKKAEYNEGKQKLVADTYRLRQRIEARKMRADRIEGLELGGKKEE